MSTSEAANIKHNAQRRMFFHYLRLSAALEAFQIDPCAGHQEWWLRNLKFELVRYAMTCHRLLTMHNGRTTH